MAKGPSWISKATKRPNAARRALDTAVPVNGIDIGFRQCGSGPELLVVAGRGTSMSLWTVDLLQALSEHLHVTIFDNRGVGYTTDDLSQLLTVPLMAEDTAGLIAVLGLGQPTVLGRSMGGQIGLTLAVLHPEQLSRLVTSGADTGGTHSVQSAPTVGAQLSDPNVSAATLLGLLFPSTATGAPAAFVAQCVLQTSDRSTRRRANGRSRPTPSGRSTKGPTAACRRYRSPPW